VFVTLQHIRVNLELVGVKKVGDEVILGSWGQSLHQLHSQALPEFLQVHLQLHKFLLQEQEELLSRRLPGAKNDAFPFSIFFGHSTPDRQPTLARNRKDDLDFQFLLTSRKLH
jgi:hypothetical protein